MKRRFLGYLVQEFWFGKDDPSFAKWEPNSVRAYRSAQYLVRHHRDREDPRYWVHISVTDLRTGRSVSCC